MPNTTSDTSCDVLVVGAGPVGLTMAWELVRHGVKCRIIDSAPTPTDKSKALVLWGRTLELLADGGIAEQFVSAGMFAHGASIYGSGKRLVRVSIERNDTAFPHPVMLAQSETERLLNENLRRVGITVERPVELTEVAEVGDHVEATLVHGDGQAEHVHCAWLVGCDGSHSTVRKRLGIEFTGEFEPNDWMLADVHLDGSVPNDEVSVFWHSDGLVVFFPFARDRFRVAADLGKAPGLEKPPDPTLEQVQAVVDQRGPAGVRLYDPVWLSGFRIHERKVAQYSRGRIFLAGDAAHIHSPAGGQGMNTGMQDAYNLAWKLALVQRGLGRPSPLLDSYTEERSAVGDMVLRNAGFLTRVATLRNPMLQFLRNHLFSLAGKLSAVQERAVAELTEMAVHYPASLLNGEEPGSAWNSEVKPGDRLPDAVLRDAASGQPVRLHEALRGTGYELLVMPAAGDADAISAMNDGAGQIIGSYGDSIRVHWIVPPAMDAKAITADPQAVGSGVLIDEHHELRDRLGLRGSAIALIRPDKYLGFRGHANAWPALREHLGRFLNAFR